MFTDNAPAPQESCLVLLSGGLDSAVTLALAKLNSKTLYTLTFNYGQKHDREAESAQKLSNHYNTMHFSVYDISLRAFKGLNKSDDVTPMPFGLMPQTWKPGRNIMFLSYAGAFCVQHSIHMIAVGIHAEDQPGYPDCGSTFLCVMESVLQLGLSHPLSIWAPLLNKDKPRIVELGCELGVPFEMTWSCYEGGEKPCMECDACARRAAAFATMAKKDPLLKEEK